MKARILIVLAAVLGFLPTCSDSSDHYYAFLSTRNGKWGMISPHGKVLFDNEFKTPPTDADGGVFFVRTGKNDKWQMYDANNGTVSITDKSYDAVLPFTEDVTLAVRENEFIKIIDKLGNEVATLDRVSGETIYAAYPFSDGLSIIWTHSGFGVVNAKGEVVVKPKFCLLLPFSDGVAIGIENKYKDMDPDSIMWSVIDTNGQTLFTFKKSKYVDLAPGFRNGLLAVCKEDQRCGFIDKTGEEVVKATAKNANIGDWNDKVFVFYDGDQWGLKKMSNDEVLIRCKYDALEFADKEGRLLWACEDGSRGLKWTLINRKGERVSKDSYKDHKMFSGKYCPVQVSDNEWTFIDRKGVEQKLKSDIYTIGGYAFEDCLFSKRETGEAVINILYDSLYSFLIKSGLANNVANDYPNTLNSSSSSSASVSSDVPGRYPEGSTRYLTAYDLVGKSKWELKVMRNEIYARHHYIFKSADLQEHFAKEPWYYGYISDAKEAARLFSYMETKNVELIKEYEKQF